MKKRMIVIPLIALWCSAYGSQGTQTDWSGDYGVLGPVIELGTDFWHDSDVNRLASPGDLSLEYTPVVNALPMTDLYGLVILDFDNDGDQDIAASCSNPDGYVVLENQDGLGLTWNEITIVDLPTSPWKATSGDFNGDGFDDLVGCTDFYSDSIYLMLSPGGPGPWTVSILDPDHGAFSLTTADLNGDGLLDVAGGGYSPTNMCCWLNQGDGSFQFVQVDGYYIPSDVTAGDIDGDGDTDLAISSSQQGAYRWFENLGMGLSWASWYITSSATAIMTGVDLGDVDGDGDLDLATTRWYDSVGYWDNVDGVGGDWDYHMLETGQLYQSPVVEDWDNDGDLDIAATDRMKGPTVLFLNDGSAVPGWERHSSSVFDETSYVVNCDLNGDGYDDMITSSATADSIVWLDDLCNSYSIGMLESSVIQVSIGAPDSIAWGTITWSRTEPAGTSIGFALRSDSTLYQTISSDWVDTLTVSGSTLQGLFPQNCQYLQYMAVLETTDPTATPVLHDVTFDWVVMGISDEESTDEPVLRIVENPVRSTAAIYYAVTGTGASSLEVFDMAGRTVRSYTPESPGEGTAFIHGLPAGIYTVILYNDSDMLTEQFVQLGR